MISFHCGSPNAPKERKSQASTVMKEPSKSASGATVGKTAASLPDSPDSLKELASLPLTAEITNDASSSGLSSSHPSESTTYLLSTSRSGPVAGPVDNDSVPASCLYPELPSPLEVKINEKSGRGIWLKKGHSIKFGAMVMQVDPDAACISTEHLGQRCSACFLTVGGILLRCNGCKVLRYCSKACQNNNWRTHKDECKQLKKGKEWVPREDVRLVARLLWKANREGNDGVWWKEILRMHWLRDGRFRKDMKKFGEQVGLFMGVENTADFYNTLGFATIDEWFSFLIAVRGNRFGIQLCESNVAGFYISRLTALLNHSCEPNVRVLFPWGGGPKGKLEVIAVRDIEGGEELRTSYVETLLPRRQRQAALERWLFTCECTVCRREAESQHASLRLCLKCRTPDCTSRLPLPERKGREMLNCCICKSSFEIDLTEVWAVIGKGELVLEAAKENENDRTFGSISSVLPDLFTYLPVSAFPLFPLLRLYHKMCWKKAKTESKGSKSPHDQLVDEARQCSHLVISALLELYPGSDQVAVESRMFAHYVTTKLDESDVTEGKNSILPPELRVTFPLEWHERMAMAEEALTNAYATLCIVCGKDGGSLGMEVKKELDQVRMALRSKGFQTA